MEKPASVAQKSRRFAVRIIRLYQYLTAEQKEYVLLPYEQAEGMEYSRGLLQAAKGKKSIAVFIGPEGGFETSEIEYAMEKGVKPITLGKRILRTETAGLTTLSILMYHLEG